MIFGQVVLAITVFWPIFMNWIVLLIRNLDISYRWLVIG